MPKAVNEASFSWHATFPPGTFVPPHIHPTQDEFIYMFEGRFDLMLDGRDFIATAGDLIRLPMGLPHGIFNKSDQPVKCFFWVAPTRKLYDLFWAIHAMKEQKPEEVVALSAKHEVVFLPPPAYTGKSGRIFQAEGAGIVVIGEDFGVASPGDHRAQRLLRVFGAHVIFQLVEEPALRRDVVGALLEHMADMRGQRNVGQELALEQLLAVVGAQFGELLADIGELDVAAFDFRQAETSAATRRPGIARPIPWCSSSASTGKSALPLNGAAASVSIRPDNRLADTRGSTVLMVAAGPRSPICDGVGVRAVIAT